MNWKGYGRKRQWLYLRHYPFIVGTEESLDKSIMIQYLACGPEFETGNSQTWSIIAAYLRTTFPNTETKVDTRMRVSCPLPPCGIVSLQSSGYTNRLFVLTAEFLNHRMIWDDNIQDEVQRIGKKWFLAVSRFHLSIRLEGLTQCKLQHN
jgi:hypothetical protein